MNERLSRNGYEQTKAKLAQLEQRLNAINNRTDLSADRLADVKRSYEMMIRQYRHDIKLYEAAEAHSKADQVTDS
jgi:hypothetical protein